MSSKKERIIFSEREFNFVYFAKLAKFETRMHSLKLGEV